MKKPFPRKQAQNEAPDATPAAAAVSVMNNDRPSPAAEILRERARCKAIMQVGIDLGIPRIAMSIAFKTNIHAEKAVSSLRFIAGLSDALPIAKG